MVSTHLKNNSQVGVKMKNIWNHQPARDPGSPSENGSGTLIPFYRCDRMLMDVDSPYQGYHETFVWSLDVMGFRYCLLPSTLWTPKKRLRGDRWQDRPTSQLSTSRSSPSNPTQRLWKSKFCRLTEWSCLKKWKTKIRIWLEATTT